MGSATPGRSREVRQCMGQDEGSAGSGSRSTNGRCSGSRPAAARDRRSDGGGHTSCCWPMRTGRVVPAATPTSPTFSRPNRQDPPGAQAMRGGGSRGGAFEETVSGAARSWPRLEEMLSGLRPGDVVTVTHLDRLALSTVELLRLAETIGATGAGLCSLAEPWADTTSPSGRMVLTIFAGIAEFE